VQLRAEDPERLPGTLDAYVKIGVTDFLLIVHGDDPVAVVDQVAGRLPRLRELG
jgi:hypothetical protein